MKILFSFFLISIFLFSCSLVKNPQSSNFNRVKYHAHFKGSKSKKEFIPKTVHAFEKKSKKLENQSIQIKRISLDSTSLLAFHSNGIKSVNKSTKEPNPLAISQIKTILKDASSLTINNENTLNRVDNYWWDDDPEDWPWGEIVLAVIAILLIAILIAIFVNLLGALISSLFALILLLGLAYLLYLLWV